MGPYKNLEVIVGNIRFNPHALRQFLKKSHYWLTYKPVEEIFTLEVNDGWGGMKLFEVKNASHEKAEKFAILLGLAPEEREDNLWSKFNPTVYLNNDGSEDAEKIRMELLKLGIPFRETCLKSSQGWRFQSQMYEYAGPSYTSDDVIDIIRGIAERDKKELETLP